MDTSTRWVLIVIWLMVAGAIAVTAWLYLYQKNYNFVVEAACNPSTQNCFHRDCSSADSSCPPNNWEDYKVFRIKAKDFASCSADSCASECLNGTAPCVEELCSSSSANSCSANPEQSVQ